MKGVRYVVSNPMNQSTGPEVKCCNAGCIEILG